MKSHLFFLAAPLRFPVPDVANHTGMSLRSDGGVFLFASHIHHHGDDLSPLSEVTQNVHYRLKHKVMPGKPNHVDVLAYNTTAQDVRWPSVSEQHPFTITRLSKHVGFGQVENAKAHIMCSLLVFSHSCFLLNGMIRACLCGCFQSWGFVCIFCALKSSLPIAW